MSAAPGPQRKEARDLTALIFEIGYLADLGHCACETDIPISADQHFAALERQFEVISRLAREAGDIAELAGRARL